MQLLYASDANGIFMSKTKNKISLQSNLIMADFAKITLRDSLVRKLFLSLI